MLTRLRQHFFFIKIVLFKEQVDAGHLISSFMIEYSLCKNLKKITDIKEMIGLLLVFLDECLISSHFCTSRIELLASFTARSFDLKITETQ